MAKRPPSVKPERPGDKVAPSTVVALAQRQSPIQTLHDSCSTNYTGTREALIEAGLATAEMFPEGRKYIRRARELPDMPDRNWRMTRLAGGKEFRLTRYHAWRERAAPIVLIRPDVATPQLQAQNQTKAILKVLGDFMLMADKGCITGIAIVGLVPDAGKGCWASAGSARTNPAEAIGIMEVLKGELLKRFHELQ